MNTYVEPITYCGVECRPYFYCFSKFTDKRRIWLPFYKTLLYTMVENILNFNVKEEIVFTFQRFPDEYHRELDQYDEINYVDRINGFTFHKDLNKLDTGYVLLYVTGLENEYRDNLELQPEYEKAIILDAVIDEEPIVLDLAIQHHFISRRLDMLVIHVLYYIDAIQALIRAARTPRMRSNVDEVGDAGL